MGIEPWIADDRAASALVTSAPVPLGMNVDDLIAHATRSESLSGRGVGDTEINWCGSIIPAPMRPFNFRARCRSSPTALQFGAWARRRILAPLQSRYLRVFSNYALTVRLQRTDLGRMPRLGYRIFFVASS